MHFVGRFLSKRSVAKRYLVFLAIVLVSVNHKIYIMLQSAVTVEQNIPAFMFSI